jgi:hypothetical protein
MPEAVTFKVTTYRKLAKDETGYTELASQRVDAAAALVWVLDELPDDAWEVEHADSGEPGWDRITLHLDWSKVPDSVRAPKLPARRR